MLIEKAKELEDAEEKEAAVIHIGRLMKSFQNTWNRDNVDDDTIVQNLRTMSKGALIIDLEKVRNENLFESLVKERRSRPNNKGRRNGGRRRRN